MWKNIYKQWKLLKHYEYAVSQKQYLNNFTLQNMNFFLTSQED